MKWKIEITSEPISGQQRDELSAIADKIGDFTTEDLRGCRPAVPRWLNWLAWLTDQPRMKVEGGPWVYFWSHRLHEPF